MKAPSRRMGLRELIARSKPTECPFCGEPRAAKRTKPHLTCGAPECATAYQRLWKRDMRALVAEAVRAAVALELALGGAP